MRERLLAQGAQVTMLIPTGGPILPVSGRYYPGAGGQCDRQPVNQATPTDFDLIILPDGIDADKLARCPNILQLIQGIPSDATSQPLPVFTVQFMDGLLDRGVQLEGLQTTREPLVASSTRGK